MSHSWSRICLPKSQSIVLKWYKSGGKCLANGAGVTQFFRSGNIKNTNTHHGLSGSVQCTRPVYFCLFHTSLMSLQIKAVDPDPHEFSLRILKADPDLDPEGKNLKITEKF